jgi:hypothetical protein
MPKFTVIMSSSQSQAYSVLYTMLLRLLEWLTSAWPAIKCRLQAMSELILISVTYIKILGSATTHTPFLFVNNHLFRLSTCTRSEFRHWKTCLSTSSSKLHDFYRPEMSLASLSQAKVYMMLRGWKICGPLGSILAEIVAAAGRSHNLHVRHSSWSTTKDICSSRFCLETCCLHISFATPARFSIFDGTKGAMKDMSVHLLHEHSQFAEYHEATGSSKMYNE